MPLECPGCGVQDVQWEGYDAQQICTECGYVISSQTTLVSAGDGIECYENSRGFQGLPKLFVQRNTKTDSRYKIHAIMETRKIAHTLKLSTEKVEECCSLFEQIYHNPIIINERLKSKLIIGGCICYTLCRLHGWPVSSSQICTLLGCTLPEFMSLLKRLQQILPAQYKVIPPDITELVPAFCSEAGLDELQRDTVKLIELCKQVFLVDGRKHSAVVITAIYIVWQAKKFEERKKVTISSFCKKHNLKFSDACNVRLKEIQGMLCNLATELPWVSPNSAISRNAVGMYLRDILQYQQSLIMDAALKNQEGGLSQEDPNDQSQSSEVKNTENTIASVSASSNAEKRTLDSYFHPPAFKKSRKEVERPPEQHYGAVNVKDLESPHLTEENTFPDAELSRYIRSPKEVEMLKSLLDKTNA